MIGRLLSIFIVWSIRERREDLASTGSQRGGRGSHRSTAAVGGEAGEGSQEVGDALSGGSRPVDIVFCSGSVVSSGDGAPWSGSTAAFPARSVQGKEPWRLAEVKGVVFGGKGGRVRRGEGGHLLGGSQRAPALSPLLAAARGRGRAALPRRGEGSGESGVV
jgi:hypothetical protein